MSDHWTTYAIFALFAIWAWWLLFCYRKWGRHVAPIAVAALLTAPNEPTDLDVLWHHRRPAEYLRQAEGAGVRGGVGRRGDRAMTDPILIDGLRPAEWVEECTTSEVADWTDAINALAQRVRQAALEEFETEERIIRGRTALVELMRAGYRYCDIPACNCNNFHPLVRALAEEKDGA